MITRGSLFSSVAVVAVACAAVPAAAQQSQPATVATGVGSPTKSAPPADTQSSIDAPAKSAIPTQAGEAGDTGGDVIVTASRAGRAGYDAPTPSKVLNAAAIQDRGSTNIGDYLNEIPAFRPSQIAQTNPQQNSGAGQTYADLRGLGNIRTLTLVDGRRFVPTAATGQVDLNLIPTILTERVEVVTGGASAQWGSDAVAGVVNIILDKRLQGYKTFVDPSDPLYNSASPISIINNDVNGCFYLNVSASAKVINAGSRKVEIYGLINNLTNTGVLFPATQTSGLYDRIGRFYRVGFRLNY